MGSPRTSASPMGAGLGEPLFSSKFAAGPLIEALIEPVPDSRRRNADAEAPGATPVT